MLITQRFLLSHVAVFCFVLSQTAVVPAALVRTVMLSGDQAPGTAAGVSFVDAANLMSPGLNSTGRAVFTSDLTGPGVDGSNRTGLWSEGGGGGLSLIAREGSQAPDTVGGVFFGDFTFTPLPLSLNSAGQTVFKARVGGLGVTSSNDDGIWSEGGGGGLALLAREGDQAPDTPVGVNFGSLPVSSHLALNDAGQTVFKANLTGTGITPGNNDFGIW